jgi:hypothetical protein
MTKKRETSYCVVEFPSLKVCKLISDNAWWYPIYDSFLSAILQIINSGSVFFCTDEACVGLVSYTSISRKFQREKRDIWVLNETMV